MNRVTITEALAGAAARLDRVADNPRREARLLLAHALGLSANDLIRDPDRLVDDRGFGALVARRAEHEPVALILGYREFWSLRFLVSSATLIPRPDTETLVDATLAAFAGRPPPKRILDLGTGTGCLLLALLTEYPSAFGIGVDLAADAAELARANASQLGLIDRAAFVVSKWTNALNGQFDMIISNPPYVPHAEIESLMPEVAGFEPACALDGGSDGLDAYRLIIPKLRQHLVRNGIAVLEVGSGQATFVMQLAREAGFIASYRADLAEISRAVILALPDR